MEKLRQHIEEIVSLSDNEFEMIKPFFTTKRTLKNQFLINEGDDVQYEFLVISGIFKVFY